MSTHSLLKQVIDILKDAAKSMSTKDMNTGGILTQKQAQNSDDILSQN